MSDFWKDKQVKARNSHACDLCGKTINRGDEYSYGSGVVDGDFMVWRECMPCVPFDQLYFTQTGDDRIDQDSCVEFARETLSLSHAPIFNVKVADLQLADAFMRRYSWDGFHGSDWGDDDE